MPRLTDLLPSWDGAHNPEIAGLTADSRHVANDTLFAAIPGGRADGRDYIGQAIDRGAVAVLAPVGTSGLPVPTVESDCVRRDLALAAARFYRRQPETIVAVTGTNGKTSTVGFARQIWQGCGQQAASLGTLGLVGANLPESPAMTTPDAVTLHAMLATIADAGIDRLALEASSHGLDQFRLDGVRLKAAGFTNLTHDHLDYHASMEGYRAAKLRLFTDILADDGFAVLNADAQDYETFRKASVGKTLIDYGADAGFLRIERLEPQGAGQSLCLRVDGERHDLRLNLSGAFMAMNAVCALGLCLAVRPPEIGVAALVQMLEHLQGAPGRMQRIAGERAIFIDYAHTPDALENVLRALRPHTPGRLIALFGCGGDRDRAKRPVMGNLAGALADLAIITDDNPRSEKPEDIRAAILAEAGPRALEIGDRRQAIRHAVGLMQPGDTLLIAGKGHEAGQTIGAITYPFDDAEEARAAIAACDPLSQKAMP